MNLKNVFDFHHSLNKRFACHWVDSGQHWYVCPSAVYCEPTKEADTKVLSYGDCPVSPALEKNKSVVYPENYIEEVISDLPEAFLKFLYTGDSIVTLDGKQEIELKLQAPMRVYMTSYTEFPELKGLKYSLCKHKGTGLPMLKVEEGDTFMCFLMAKESKPSFPVVTTEKCKYKAIQWSDEESCYKKVEKENLNMELETDKLVKDILGEAKVSIDPNKTGKELLAEQKAKAAAEATKALVQEVKKESVAAAKEEAPVKEEAAVEVKRTRKKAEVTKVQDLTKIIEQLGGAVPDGMSSEDVQREIRQLRDLILAASRRMANVSLGSIEKNSAAAAKLAQIKAAL